MEKSVFKVGDKVFDYHRGWGKVCRIINKKEYGRVGVKFSDGNLDFYTWDGRAFVNQLQVLSFTEYTLDGFSQERPEELPKKGQIVWGSNCSSSWCICYFLEEDAIGGYRCTVYNPFIPNPSYTHWNRITTENPYKDE